MSCVQRPLRKACCVVKNKLNCCKNCRGKSFGGHCVYKMRLQVSLKWHQGPEDPVRMPLLLHSNTLCRKCFIKTVVCVCVCVHQMVEAHLPQSVRDILKWTVDFFRKNLLGWIREHGGWVCWTIFLSSVISLVSEI